MDADKLNEACDTAFLENYFPSATESPDPRWEMFADGFKQGASWLMRQPLSDRLSDEEKEKIRAIYKDYEELETYGEALSDRTAGRMQCFTLEQIFGKELFNEK